MNPLGGLRETGGLPLFSPEGRTYSPPAEADGGSPPVGRARALSEGDCGSCGSRWTRLHFCQTASLAHAVGAGVSVLEAPVHGVVYCHPIPPPAYENLPPAAFTQLWVSHFQRHPCSLFKREIERKDGENKWQSIIWKQK